jgi:Tetratricopeptide repeat
MEGARDPFRRPISPTAMATQTAELEQAVDADENTLGAKHPDTPTARAALARCYLFSGRSAEAVTLLEANVPACEAVLGPDHADTLQSRNDLAVSYRSAGRAPHAVALHEQNLSIQERLLGPTTQPLSPRAATSPQPTAARTGCPRRSRCTSRRWPTAARHWTTCSSASTSWTRPGRGT